VAPKPDEEKIAAVRKALGEPFAAEFSDKAWKIRTQLLVTSVISLFVVLARLRIDPGSTIFGLRFSGLSDEVVRTGLFLVTLYLVAHFLGSSIDSFIEWRLRLSGTKLAFVTTGRLASEHGDYPNDPRQSTLHHWWTEEAAKIGNLASKAAEIDSNLGEWETRLRAQVCDLHPSCMNTTTAAQSISEVRERLAALTRAVDTSSKTIAAQRVPVSLDRFDRWFKLFLRSQSLRWVLIDFLLPIGLGIASLILLRRPW
jgi:hypothetical protein